MREEGERPCLFTIEKASLKGPFYLQYSSKVTTLQNKVTFYEGQIDPLHEENLLAKQNYMNLARLVSSNSSLTQ